MDCYFAEVSESRDKKKYIIKHSKSTYCSGLHRKSQTVKYIISYVSCRRLGYPLIKNSFKKFPLFQVALSSHDTFRDLMWDLIFSVNVTNDLAKAR